MRAKKQKLEHYSPVDSDYFPRYAGIPTFMRLPSTFEYNELNIGILGIPWDGGVTERAGARHGPRSVREASSFNRNEHGTTGVRVFDIVNIADIGDVPTNPVNRNATLESIKNFTKNLLDHNVFPLSVGGDHLVTFPILQGMQEKGPLALVHFDAHTDTWDVDFADEKLTHGTPFRRAVENQLIIPDKMIQIGLRELIHSKNDLKFCRENNISILTMEDIKTNGLKQVIEKIKSVIGDHNTYISFDIDVLDPAFAPGTGTPEVGGLTTHEALLILRGLVGCNIIGSDLVEVAPNLDISNITSLAGATILYELLHLMVYPFVNNAFHT